MNTVFGDVTRFNFAQPGKALKPLWMLDHIEDKSP